MGIVDGYGWAAEDRANNLRARFAEAQDERSISRMQTWFGAIGATLAAVGLIAVMTIPVSEKEINRGGLVALTLIAGVMGSALAIINHKRGRKACDEIEDIKAQGIKYQISLP